jgi:DNA-binding MarR family transcriptional regulator
VNSREDLRGDLELGLQRLCGLAGAEGLSALADADLSWSQVRVTMLLACSEQLPIRSVSERLGISVHSAGRTIDQLVELGIVDRRESQTDRRVKLVSLTPRGAEIIDQQLALRRRALQVFLDRLPDDRVTALAEALRPILVGDYLRPISVEDGPSGPHEPSSAHPTTAALATR